MQMIKRGVALASVAALMLPATAALAQILSARGTAAEHYTGRLTPAVRDHVAQEAKLNALERYIAETNPAKQRLFDAARPRLAASLDNYVLGATVLTENDDTKNKTYSITVKIDLNQARFENALSDSSGSSPSRPAGAQVAAIFVARTPTSIQQFDARVVKREDTDASITSKGGAQVQTRQGEQIRRNSIGTSDSINGSANYSQQTSIRTETGGSTTLREDAVVWRVANANDVDQQMTGVFANAGMQMVATDFIDHLNLDAIRKDFGRDDVTLSSEVLRGAANAVKGSGIPVMVIGTMDQQAPDIDPVTGSTRVIVKVNARVYDLSTPIPRVLSSVGPIQYAGVGSNQAAAMTNATILASQETAKKLVDEISVKGVR